MKYWLELFSFIKDAILFVKNSTVNVLCLRPLKGNDTVPFVSYVWHPEISRFRTAARCSSVGPPATPTDQNSYGEMRCAGP